MRAGANRQAAPSRPSSLRAEWNECGFASRWWVVSGYHETGDFKVHGDYTDEGRARDAVAAGLAPAEPAESTSAENELVEAPRA